jgi:hypothetical protein
MALSDVVSRLADQQPGNRAISLGLPLESILVSVIYDSEDRIQERSRWRRHTSELKEYIGVVEKRFFIVSLG